MMPNTTINDEKLKSAHILIVDDEPVNVLLLKRILDQVGYSNVFTTSDPREVAGLCVECSPDLLLLDLMMPFIDGYEILENVVPAQGDAYFPVLVLTADINPEAKRRALSGGAKDFLTKPFDHMEVVLRVKNLLETRFLNLQLQDQNQHLEERVRERTAELERTNKKLEIFNEQLQQSKRELEESQIEVLDRLARAAEFRDDDTGQHTQRVGATSARLAEALGLSAERVELIRRAAPLHDVGKIGISDTILLKPGKLTQEEFELMKTHAAIGAALLDEGHSSLIKTAERIALTHHERWDGKGYPFQLQGNEIPIEGRIVAVADVFDALTNERPYKKAWPIPEALAEIQAQAGRQFDPAVVEAFIQLQSSVL